MSCGLKNPIFGRDTKVLSGLRVIVTSDGSLPGGIWNPNEDGGTDDGTSLPPGVLLATARRTAQEQGLDLGNCTKFINICEIIKPPEKLIVLLIDASETALVKGCAGNPGKYNIEYICSAASLSTLIYMIFALPFKLFKPDIAYCTLLCVLKSARALRSIPF